MSTIHDTLSKGGKNSHHHPKKERSAGSNLVTYDVPDNPYCKMPLEGFSPETVCKIFKHVSANQMSNIPAVITLQVMSIHVDVFFFPFIFSSCQNSFRPCQAVCVTG